MAPEASSTKPLEFTGGFSCERWVGDSGMVTMWDDEGHYMKAVVAPWAAAVSLVTILRHDKGGCDDLKQMVMMTREATDSV